jgi:nucleotide-binding universal stress UspA family protein
MIPITHILCPVDFSEISRHAFDHAAAIARWYEARLTLLYVFECRPNLDLPPLVLDDAARESLLRDMHQLASTVSPGIAPDLLVIEAPYVHGEILAQIDALHADLLVVGTHGRGGFERVFFGSVAEKVIRAAPCPTLVVPPRAPDVAVDAPVHFRRILCPVDFSESSLDAVMYALDMAEEADARLTLLHVVEGPAMLGDDPAFPAADYQRLRADAEQRARERLLALVPEEARTYCTVETVVVEGRAHREILRQADERAADLVVMGVHGRGAIDLAVFGSTTQGVIRAATCPVLVVRTA